MHRRLETRFDQADIPPGTTLVTRNDTYRFDRVEALDDGSIRVDALVTRTGVFPYLDSLGNTIHEYRPAEEVQKADSMRTLKDRTVTVFHPPGLINADNWKDYTAGHVSGEPVAKGDGVFAQLVIKDSATIKAIQSGKLKEISCGYQLWTEDKAGVTAGGQRYDKIQRGMKYNHVAIGPENWGRQGAQTSLRLDAKGDQIFETEKRKDQMEITIVFDGQSYTVKAGSTEHTNLLAKIATKTAEDKAILDAAKAQVTAATADKARADAAEQATKDLQKKLDAAPANLLAAARARVVLEGQASRVLGDDFKFDDAEGKPVADKSIRASIISKLEPDFKADGKDEVYLTAYCDSLLKRGQGSAQETILAGHMNVDNRTGVRLDQSWFDDKGQIKLDEESPDYFDACHAKSRRDAANAHKRPLAVSKVLQVVA